MNPKNPFENKKISRQIKNKLKTNVKPVSILGYFIYS